MAKQIFVNLPVKDLKKSIDFFTKLGFTFNPKFTNENASCMIIGENIFAMLLVEMFFKGFIPGKEISDTLKTTEALIGITAESRNEVDDLIAKVTAAGRKEYREKSDYGWMYSRSFEDLDGHIWEIFFMDESAMPKG